MPISRSAKSLHRTLPCAAELQNGRPNATKMHFCLCDSCVAAEKKTAAVHDLDERHRERPQSNSLAVQWDCVGYSDRPVKFRTVDIGKTQHFRRMNVLNFPTSGTLPAIMSQTCSANCDLFCNSYVFICFLAVCRTLSST